MALSTEKTIDAGSYSDEVRELQKALNEVQDAGLAVAGYFGASTRAEIIRFQREHKLTDDGVAGPVTLAAINEALSPKPVEKGPQKPAQGSRKSSPSRRA